MDSVYQMKLEQAAMAPDEAFPELLFKPLANDFGDMYFKLDPTDYRQEAVKVDPRFTVTNIRRMRGTAKTIYRYLEWITLWDDYMEYLKNTYGSVEIAYQMHEAGTLPDPFPTISHRPILRKGRLRKLLKNGELMSYTPPSISTADCLDYFKKVLDQEVIEHNGEEEPDINWALDHKPSKKEQLLLKKSTDRYKRQHRREILISGTAANGVQSNMDFVDNYYINLDSGVYDTQWTDHDQDGTSITAQMKAMEDRKYRHIGQIMDEEAKKGSSRYIYDGNMIKDREKTELFEIYKHLQKYTGIDVLGTLAHNVSKKRFKAIRTGMQSVGADIGLTKKEQKKLKKKQKKLEREQERINVADEKLSQILLNNKIFSNGGTVRFEDLRRNAGFDDDDY